MSDLEALQHQHLHLTQKPPPKKVQAQAATAPEHKDITEPEVAMQGVTDSEQGLPRQHKGKLISAQKDMETTPIAKPKGFSETFLATPQVCSISCTTKKTP